MTEWDRESAFAVAAEHRDRADLRVQYPGADRWLRRNFLLDEALPRQTVRWTKEKAFKAAKNAGGRRELQRQTMGE